MEPDDLSLVSTYRVYFTEEDGSQSFLAEVPKGSVSVPVPFNTPMLNFTQIVVRAWNPVGESLLRTNISIIDATADSCPADSGHHYVSSRWRVVGGPTSKSWHVRA